MSLGSFDVEKNLDCRTNIINTITDLFKTNDRLIILEDDLVLGPNFLSYMNNALNKYINNTSNNVFKNVIN